jgi:hypothetical protein
MLNIENSEFPVPFRWIAVVMLSFLGLHLLQMAGRKFFSADVPEDFYKEPGMKDQFVLWGYISLLFSLAFMDRWR